MSSVQVAEPSNDLSFAGTAELGEELVDLSSRLATMEARWLAVPTEFDRRRAGGTTGSCLVSTGWCGAAG